MYGIVFEGRSLIGNHRKSEHLCGRGELEVLFDHAISMQLPILCVVRECEYDLRVVPLCHEELHGESRV